MDRGQLDVVTTRRSAGGVTAAVGAEEGMGENAAKDGTEEREASWVGLAMEREVEVGSVGLQETMATLTSTSPQMKLRATSRGICVVFSS